MNVFVGELPPPYGGVAVKDKLMFQQMRALQLPLKDPLRLPEPCQPYR